MKNKEVVQRSYDEDFVVSVTCDMCKKTYTGSKWENGTFDVTDTEVVLKTGTMYPEGGSGEELEFDICPKCFKEVLIPTLKNLGASPQVTEWSVEN